jgi:2,3-bisphosphoglycerate-independent phosphoglycerate mutase
MYVFSYFHVKENINMHICGILSDGAIHGHINHLFAILDLCREHQFYNVFIHPFLDGRDTPPLVAPKYVESLENKLKELGFGKIATIQGRYYAMNRDRNWELTKLAYKAMVKGEGVNYANNTKEAFELEYKENLTDEFMKPTVLLDNNEPVSKIKNNDVIVMYNYREDRMIQLLHAFNDKDFNNFERDYIRTKYVTMTPYEEVNNYDNVEIIFKKDIASENNLGSIIDKNNLSQLRITEYEKSKHITFFFDGCTDRKYPKEDIIIFERPDVFTYDEKPEMRSEDITNKIVESIKENKYDLIIVNYPNGDAVGHTGNMEAAIKAVDALDICIKRLYDAVQNTDYTLIVTADHGNCEQMIDENGGPDKMHTTNPIPFIICDKSYQVKDGKLGDIAPTILTIMGLDIPKEMTGDILIK